MYAAQLDRLACVPLALFPFAELAVAKGPVHIQHVQFRVMQHRFRVLIYRCYVLASLEELVSLCLDLFSPCSIRCRGVSAIE